MKRRKFIKITAAAAPIVSLFPADLSTIYRTKKAGVLEKRALGRTGQKLSILGLGGVVMMDTTPDQASEYVRLAIDNGINYFDVAPSYGDAEVKLGPALEPYRSGIFLACKTQERKYDGALKELNKSLKNLRTDHFDLYQLHAVRKLEDVDTIFGEDGAIKAFIKARDEGKIRYIGFSAHSVEAAMALMDRFDFDTILFPINFATWYAGNFGPQVLERATNKGMGILAIKAMARRPYPEDTENRISKCWYEPLTDPEEALMGLRFTLSHPVTAAIPPGNEDLFKLALDLIKRFEPLKPSEVMEMKEKGLAEKPLFSYPMD
jgi:predicted aldo/keto reductase-like oxidoreductase